MGRDWVHLLRRPLTGLLYQLRITDDDELAGETEVLEENLPQFQFVRHKSYMTRPGLEPGPPRWEAGV
jgi:hypothetical protein